MGITDTIRSAIMGEMPKVGRGGLKPNDKEFRDTDFTSGDVTCTAGSPNRLGGYKVSSGEAIAFGSGSKDSENQGYMYYNVQNTTPANLDGELRFIIENMNKVTKDVVRSIRTESLRVSGEVRTERVPFPEMGMRAVEDWFASLYFVADSADTYSESDSDALIPVTQYLAL